MSISAKSASISNWNGLLRKRKWLSFLWVVLLMDLESYLINSNILNRVKQWKSCKYEYVPQTHKECWLNPVDITLNFYPWVPSYHSKVSDVVSRVYGHTKMHVWLSNLQFLSILAKSGGNLIILEFTYHVIWTLKVNQEECFEIFLTDIIVLSWYPYPVFISYFPYSLYSWLNEFVHLSYVCIWGTCTCITRNSTQNISIFYYSQASLTSNGTGVWQGLFNHNL